MGGAWIKSQHIPDDKSRSDLRNLHGLLGKRLIAQVSQIRRVALYLRTGVVLMLQLESSRHGRSVDHVLTYSGRQIDVGSQKPSRITRQKTGSGSESNTSVRADDKSRSDLRKPRELRGKRLVAQESQTRRFALYLRTGVVLMLQLESSSHGRSVDHVSTYSGRQIAVGSPKPSLIRRKKTRCASESNTSVRVVLANRGVDHVSTYSERQIAVGSQKPSRITRQKACCASESNTSVRLVLANRSGFDAPIGDVLAWEERGSCLNIFRTENRDEKSRSDLINLHELRGKRLVAQVSHTGRSALSLRTGLIFMLQLESSWHGRSVDHVSTYSGRQIAVGSQKPSRITRQKTCCESESHTSVRVVLANRGGFDAPIRVVLAWEERGSCLNLFRTTNRGRIS
ncbi:uncharacterized protein G2W53_010023 [Senna tora]|uniref:Uncharacterized protein n=1 Tax=Senna tora TaxID=362788 RepID=A0A834WZ67_9FABA|nr:uncharacterized protein G2W53_010023 [Senna tora]